VAEILVLIADDAPAAKRSLRRIIGGLPGFRLAGEASDGREALTLALELRPQVLITDIRMPYLDGLSLAAELRRRGSEVDVVIVTGYADFEYARTAMRHQVTEYLLKPIVPEEVSRVLHRIAGARQGHGEPEASLPLAVRACLAHMDRHFVRPDLSLSEVAEASGCSPAHLSRLFKRSMGVGYAEHLRRLRMQLAVKLLANPVNHAYEVARHCGYASYSHFERVFREFSGQSPSCYRSNGSHESARNRRKPG
jgi:two-component system, response regulator YesN